MGNSATRTSFERIGMPTNPAHKKPAQGAGFVISESLTNAASAC